MAESITYPRVYAYGPVIRLLWSIFYLAVVVGGLASTLCWLFDLTVLQQLAINSAGLAFAVGAAIGLLFSLRGKLILHKDYLEYHGVFAHRRISRNNIKETCEAKREFGVFYITLVMMSGRPKRVQICDFGKMDETFEDFINAYPNVEIEAEIAEEEARSTAVDQNLVFGSNEDQRIDKPRIERVQVLGKDTTGSDPDYELRLASWGTLDEKDYEVSRKLYDKVQVGQEVCVRIYPGWLGWENYYVRSCDTGKSA